MHVTIESLAFGGDGVGRIDGRAVFVPDTAPGDEVRVEITREHRRWARARVVEVVRSGLERRDPPCPLAGTCGGCSWQHVAQQEQLRSKRRILEQALRKLPLAALDFEAPAEPFAYRRRARMRWEASRGHTSLGFVGRRSHGIVDLEHCPLLCPALAQFLVPLRRALSCSPGGRGQLALLGGRDGEVHLSLRVERGAPPPVEALIDTGARGGAVCRRGAEPVRFGRDAIELEEAELWASALGFAQANAAGNARLRRIVAERASAGRVLELYAGNGNLSEVLARDASEVIAVEAAAEGARLLRRNVARHDLPVRVLEQAARRALARVEGPFDLVVVDPPREGAAEIVDRLASLAIRRVLYVSCDPMTLARDLGRLCAAGYGGLEVIGLDMMPQTFHIEAVAELTLR